MAFTLTFRERHWTHAIDARGSCRFDCEFAMGTPRYFAFGPFFIGGIVSHERQNSSACGWNGGNTSSAQARRRENMLGPFLASCSLSELSRPQANAQAFKAGDHRNGLIFNYAEGRETWNIRSSNRGSSFVGSCSTKARGTGIRGVTLVDLETSLFQGDYMLPDEYGVRMMSLERHFQDLPYRGYRGA